MTAVMMIAEALDDRALLEAIDAGCSGLTTMDGSADDVAPMVRRAASGEAAVATQLLGRLLQLLGQDHPSADVGADLSRRERQVLDLLTTGASNRVIAAELEISVNTVRNHVQQVLLKLDAHSKLEAMAIVSRRGIVSQR